MLPVLFKIGSFAVHTYGVLMMIAFVVSVWYAQRRGEKKGIPKKEIADLSIWMLVAGVLGARLLYIAQEFRTMKTSEILSFQFAGLTSFGAIIAGLIVLFIFAKKRGRPAIEYMDAMGPPLIVGQAIGRVGCLLNGCCLGGVCPANLPWGVTVAGDSHLFHPAQIYESLMLMAGLGIVVLIERRGLRLGQVFGLSFVVLGVARFIYEFWRAGTDAQVDAHIASSTYWGSLPITQAQAVAAVMAIAGVVAFIVYGRRPESSIRPQMA